MFVKTTDGKVTQYPYTTGDLRRDNPNVSFPKKIPDTLLEEYGVHPVVYQAAPEYDPMTQRVQHSSMPVLNGGSWTITKTVVDLTDEQVAHATKAKAKEMRQTRDALLSDTDWTQVADAPVDATAWATYRQALRDITSHANWPYLDEADWPTKP